MNTGIPSFSFLENSSTQYYPIPSFPATDFTFENIYEPEPSNEPAPKRDIESNKRPFVYDLESSSLSAPIKRIKPDPYKTSERTDFNYNQSTTVINRNPSELTCLTDSINQDSCLVNPLGYLSENTENGYICMKDNADKYCQHLEEVLFYRKAFDEDYRDTFLNLDDDFDDDHDIQCKQLEKDCDFLWEELQKLLKMKKLIEKKKYQKW